MELQHKNSDNVDEIDNNDTLPLSSSLALMLFFVPTLEVVSAADIRHCLIYRLLFYSIHTDPVLIHQILLTSTRLLAVKR